MARAAITLVASVSAGPPCGGLYLKPPSRGGLCDGVTTMPSAVLLARRCRIVHDDRAGDRRRRRVVLVVRGADRDTVCDQHLDGCRPGRRGECVGVFADVERTGDALGRAVLDDRLGRRGDVRIVERGVQARPAMSGGTEDHLLVGIAGVGDEVVIGADDCVDVDEVFREGRLAGARVSHGPHSAVVSAGQWRAGGYVLSICASRCGLSARSARCRSLSFDRMGSMSSSSFNRPGAVDLSQLAQRAKQSAATQASGPRPPGASYVVEVTEQTFEAETIRKSVKHPVVVELYSPRVATGQQLSDALIEIANASDGKFLLARLNVDTAPGIVQALGLQAVPTVIALLNGQLAPLFQGVLPKDQVQAAIDQLLKAAVANGMVGRAEPVGI